VRLGFTVTRHTAVDDCLSDLIGVLREIATRSDCCLSTGGLGPTCDDLTAQAFAEAFELPLVFNENAFAQIEQRFQQRGKIMPAVNRKQAMLPLGALCLENQWGTAPGFALQQQRCWFVFLPGVPIEMENIFLTSVLPLLKQRFVLRPAHLVSFKTQGIGESTLQERLNTLAFPDDVSLGFRASKQSVQVKLLFDYDANALRKQNLIERVETLLADCLIEIEQ
jgi:molybdenum cofactor synthesis domain-containing protein